MGLVRTSRRRRHPSWAGPWPRNKELKIAWEIAARHQAGFTRAFLSAMRSVLDTETRKDFLQAYRTGVVEEVMAVLPFYSKDELARGFELPPGWRRFRDQIERAYAKVIQDAGTVEMARLKKDFGVTIEFSLAEEKVKKAFTADGRFIPTVPVNPYSQKWINERSLELITQGLNETQRETVRRLLAEQFAKGARAEQAYEAVADSIGLTDRYTQAVENRRQLHIDAGFPIAEANRLTSLYAATLLASRAQTIARTETIAAMSQGRNAAWEMAMDAGQLPLDVERMWITGPETADPNAPCKVCRPLDGVRAKVGAEYIPGVKMPPAHPRCRCTEALVRSTTR